MIPFLLAWLALSLIACAIWCSLGIKDSFVQGCLIGAFALILLAVYYESVFLVSVVKASRYRELR